MHKKLWFKIHWLLGIIFGITLILIGISGAILSYQKEIFKLINPDVYTVQIPHNQEILSIEEILQRYQENNKDRKINSISFSSNKSSSISMRIASKDPNNKRGETIYLNPYTSEVLPAIVGSDFFMFFFKLHRWLTFEGEYKSFGKNIVAISIIVCIILVISGIVVYWSRIRHSFFKSFIFSFKTKKRAFLSTIHSAIGMWLIPVLLLMCLTGLYWSYDWYRSAMFSIMKVEQAKSIQQKEILKQASFSNIQKAVDIFQQNVQKDYKDANLKLIPIKENVYTISYLFTDATHYRQINLMEIDISKLEVLKDVKYLDKKLNEKIMGSMLPLHSGEFFGWIGQLIFCISSALMSLFVITGYMLYYDRWKKKKAKEQKLK